MSSLTGYFEKKDGDLYGVYHTPDVVEDYNHLVNKPSINNVELIGDKSFRDLGFNDAFVQNIIYEENRNSDLNEINKKIGVNEFNESTSNIEGSIADTNQQVSNVEDIVVNGIHILTDNQIDDICGDLS